MDTPVGKVGKRRRYKNIEFWAEDGLIFIEDERDQSFKVDTCSEFAKRAVSLNREAKRCGYADEHKELCDCVCNMRDVWKEAKEQGDPSDAIIALRKARERRKVSLVTGIW